MQVDPEKMAMFIPEAERKKMGEEKLQDANEVMNAVTENQNKLIKKMDMMSIEK